MLREFTARELLELLMLIHHVKEEQKRFVIPAEIIENKFEKI